MCRDSKQITGHQAGKKNGDLLLYGYKSFIWGHKKVFGNSGDGSTTL